MQLSSKLNQHETLPPIRINALYPLSARFYAIHAVLLAVFGLLFLWLARDGTLDNALAGYWFDPLTQRFPWKDNRWLDLINHRLLKDMVIATGVTLLIAGLLRRQPRWILVALLTGIGPLVVGVLKATSAHSCPWDLVMFGGKAVAWPLFGVVPPDSGPGRCFPGGHASSGFSLMALFFLYWPTRRRLAWLCWSGAVVLGLVMGYGQMMRGAHFLTHNLWAGWWVWLAQLLTYRCVTYLMNKMRKK
ncbi:phosphatase PAP2 family protein [Pantoea sp. FN0307]|uniref:phosphatase PAP2 family protein n=1 Tax=Pantoea sp. FN0307 TaxID=3418560 RepID=UPI003CF5D45B